MADAVHKTGNKVLIDTYARRTAFRLGVAEEAVRSEFRKTRSKTFVEREQGQGDKDLSNETARPARDEFALLQLLALQDEFATWIAKTQVTDWLKHPYVARIVSEVIQAVNTSNWRGLSALIASLEDPKCKSLL